MDKNKQQIINSGLYLVSTPIGNMDDITFRALEILKKSDIILCEDTRRSLKLLNHYKIKKKLVPYHKFNEKKIGSMIVEIIKENKIVSLISDAGTPNISDPGMILVNKCIEENLFLNLVKKTQSKNLNFSNYSECFLTLFLFWVENHRI